MRSAIIEDGIVNNIIVGAIEGSTPCDDMVGIGWTHDGTSFAPPPEPEEDGAIAEERAWAELRQERDHRLAASDWVVIRALETGEPVPAEWLAYRQALRDLPEDAVDPGAPEWPDAPV